MRPTSRHRSLDGLRALALALVLAYHLDVPGFGGGFVGALVGVLLAIAIVWSFAFVRDMRRPAPWAHELKLIEQPLPRTM